MNRSLRVNTNLPFSDYSDLLRFCCSSKVRQYERLSTVEDAITATTNWKKVQNAKMAPALQVFSQKTTQLRLLNVLINSSIRILVNQDNFNYNVGVHIRCWGGSHHHLYASSTSFEHLWYLKFVEKIFYYQLRSLPTATFTYTALKTHFYPLLWSQP